MLQKAHPLKVVVDSVKEGLHFKERINLSVKFINDQNEFQSCWTEIINDKKRPNILIGVYYRHPKKNSDGEFFKNLKYTLNKVKNKNKHIVICGDFNYDLLKHEFNAHINEFINMSSSFLQPCITKPIRIFSYNRPSLVGNIFVNIYDKTIFSGNLLDKVTDHLLNFINIKNLSLKP